MNIADISAEEIARTVKETGFSGVVSLSPLGAGASWIWRLVLRIGLIMTVLSNSEDGAWSVFRVLDETINAG
jgi:hypothetical protein